MIKKQSIGSNVLLVWILFFILFVYLILRVILVPFHEDEITTWFIYIMHGQLTPICDYVDANNHVLNTNLSWVFAKIFNASPEVLRIPNLLFFPVYFFYSYKISRLLQDHYVRIVIFLGLIMAHHFFDFFGLCRGYGISMGLLLALCFHLIRFLSNNKYKDLTITLVLSFLMIWANLSLLGAGYIIFSILVFHVIVGNKSIYYKFWLLIGLFISFAIILGYATWYALYLQDIGKLYLGKNDDGFIKSTILTLQDILFRTKSFYLLTLTIFYFAIIVIGASYVIFKKGIIEYINNPINVFSILLFGNIALIFIEHHIIGVVFPIERATLYFYPLFLLVLGFTVDYFKQDFRRKSLTYIVFPILIIPLHFLFSINLDYTAAYRWESYPERFINYIYENASERDIYPIVSIYDYDRWVYYNFKNKGNIPFIDEINYPDTIADFQIGKFEDHPYMRSLYDSLDYDKRNDFILMKRKIFLNRVPILQYDSITTNGMTDIEYVGFTSDSKKDTISGTHFLYYFDLVITSPQYAFEGFIISTIDDTQIYDPVFLDRISEHWNKRHLKFGVVVSDNKIKEKIPLAYFWNKKKVLFSIESGSLTIYKIE